MATTLEISEKEVQIDHLHPFGEKIAYDFLFDFNLIYQMAMFPMTLGDP